MNQQNQETAVIIEMEREYLNSFKKLILLLVFAAFIMLEMLHDQQNGIDKIQNFFRLHFGNFFSMCVFLKSLVAVKRERIELDKKIYRGT